MRGATQVVSVTSGAGESVGLTSPARRSGSHAMQVEVRPIKSIRTAKYNPRRISEAQLASLRASIERFGFVDPVIVNDRTGVLVGGHQRVRVAKDLGLKEVPVVGVNLDEAEEKALNLALNKISGEWDLDLLRGVLEDVQASGLDLTLTGFGEIEVASLLGSANEIDYSILDEAGIEDRVEELKEGVKKSLVIEFEEMSDYEEAAPIAKKAREEGLDLGKILLEALRAYK